MSTVMKKNTQKTLITDLPDNVVDNILMRLPLKQAGKTSLLSTKWRYKWAKLPQLKFDSLYFQGPGENMDCELKLRSIFEVLILHHTPVLKLILSFSELGSSASIDKILQFALRNGVEDLTLKISLSAGHRLPVCFYSYPQFKRLCLKGFDLKPPNTWKGFQKLTSLDLWAVPFLTEGDSISSLISLCPQLVTLKLRDIYSFNLINLEINAPNLRNVHLRGSFKYFSLRNAHKLVNASFGILVIKKAYGIEEFFSGLLSIQDLYLENFRQFLTAEPTIVFKRPAPTLHSLKKMHLSNVSFKSRHDISCALWLIANSPNLRSIKIKLEGTIQIADDEPLVKVGDYFSDVSLNNLHEAELFNISGREAEMELIKLMLAKSPKLGMYSIAPDMNVGFQGKLEILAKLVQFPRASPRAEINFHLERVRTTKL